jgi:hypothetical protein
MATPLGRFYQRSPAPPGTAPGEPAPEPLFVSGADAPDALRDNIGLAEVYWASIPRKVATQRFILEETKKWARTIVVRAANRQGASWSADQMTRVVVVLDEMIETIGVLERLTFLAGKAGLPKVDLGKLLTDFVGDVQLVADFAAYRGDIIERFHETMQKALNLAPSGRGIDLYVVAHSEGTVIAFAALLDALAQPHKSTHAWVQYLRGVMTIGSPIEVHHHLWPHLWQQTTPPLAPSPALPPSVSIEWHNYMDYGDPIAYPLDSTSEWLRKTGFARYLHLHHHPFSRYFLPGKAHTDYWTDEEVFGHFFRKVVDPAVPGRANDFAAIKNKFNARVTTWIMPYFLVYALMCGGVYAMYKGVISASGGSSSLGDTTRDVFGIGALLMGITAASRLPRIADQRLWKWLGWLAFAATAGLYWLVTSDGTKHHLGEWYSSAIPGTTDATAVWLIAAFIASLSAFLTGKLPRRGHYVLPLLGLVAAIALVYKIVIHPAMPMAPYLTARADSVMATGRVPQGDTLAALLALTRKEQPSPSGWPVAIGGLLFFYLWWLGAMLFDLSFIWQRYVRNSALRSHIAPQSEPQTDPAQ